MTVFDGFDVGSTRPHHPVLRLRESSVDGTYVCGEYARPMTVRVENGKGNLDFGVVRCDFMKAERHGDTLTLSGGVASDAWGRVLSADERRAITGGNEVDVFAIADDGQTLRLDMGDGRTATFAKPPR